MATNIDPLILPARPGAAACDMTAAPDTPHERLAEYGRLFAHALLARQRTSTSVTFTFAAKAGVVDWIADLARREAACCPFLGHEVRQSGEQVTWSLSMDPGPASDAILDEVHDLPERFAQGFPAMVQRLDARGMNLVSVGPGRLAFAPEAKGS